MAKQKTPKRNMVFAEVDESMLDWLEGLPILKKAHHVKLALEVYRLLGPEHVLPILLASGETTAREKQAQLRGMLKELADKLA